MDGGAESDTGKWKHFIKALFVSRRVHSCCDSEPSAVYRAGTAVFSGGMGLYYVFGMNRIYLEQEKSSRYRLQNTVCQRITEQYQQSERLRHDMKNHIVALSALFQNKEWEKMGDYLKKMGDSGMDAGGDLTGNKAVDALLYQKRKK